MKNHLLYKSIFLISMSISVICSTAAWVFYAYTGTSLSIARYEESHRLDNYYAMKFASCTNMCYQVQEDIQRKKEYTKLASEIWQGALNTKNDIEKEMEESGYNKGEIQYIKNILSKKYE